MVLAPKDSHLRSAENAYAEGTLVLYEQDASAILAVITGWNKSKYKLLNMRGRPHELSASRLHPLPAKMPADKTSTEAKATHLLELFEKHSRLAQKHDTATLWSLVYEEGAEFTTAELTELFLGQNSLENHLSLRFALLADRVYFKRKKDLFCPRAPETVEELKKAEAVREERRKLQDLTLDAFAAKMEDKEKPLPEESHKTVHLLELVAAGAAHLDNSAQKEAQDFMKRFSERFDVELRGSREEKAYHVLRKVGHFHKNTNLALYRYTKDGALSEAAAKELAQIQETPAWSDLADEEKCLREDLTHLECLTIDDSTTEDMDDALSIEKTESGFRVGIHISDVASIVRLGSALDEYAHGRATSIYCPELTINMFPDSLAENLLSLRENRYRRTLSCMIEVDKNFEIISSRISRALIQVKHRYSYDQVEEVLAHGQHPSDESVRSDLIQDLYHFAMAYEAKRLSDGALKIPKRMVYIHLSSPEDIRNTEFEMVDVNENGPSRSLIGEMMILYNSIVASFANTHRIPLIFRAQEKPDADRGTDPNTVPPGPAQDYAMRGNLKRSSMGTTAASHATLALDAYAQVTSPIRRYLDLVNQRQILHFLSSEEVPYSEDQLMELIRSTEEALLTASRISRESRHFWMLKYLEQKAKKKETISATVVRTDLKNPLVETEEIYLKAVLRTKRKLKLGQVLELKIANVDSRFDYLKFEIADER